MFITKGKNDACVAVAMTTFFPADPVLIKTEIPSFCLKQGPSIPI